MQVQTPRVRADGTRWPWIGLVPPGYEVLEGLMLGGPELGTSNEDFAACVPFAFGHTGASDKRKRGKWGTGASRRSILEIE